MIQDLRGTFTGLQSVQVALPPLAHVVKAMSQPLFFESIETFLAQKKGLSASVKTKQKNNDNFDKCHFGSLTTKRKQINSILLHSLTLDPGPPRQNCQGRLSPRYKRGRL